MEKGKSIRTNYNINYKQRIKRAKSKPNISSAKYIFNAEINNDKSEKFINDIRNKTQNYNNIYSNKEESEFNPSEEIYSSIYNGNKNENENTKRVINSNYQDPPRYKKQLNNYNTPKDEWNEMLYHPTENRDLAYRIVNSKTFESNIFPIDETPIDKIRHIKETKYSDRLHKTQITTLPGCIKRGKYDIKDDKYFGIKNTESYLYKVEYDYNSNLHFGPLSKEEKKIDMNFPVKQRYQGSYHRGVKDNDIFNLNNEEEKQNNYIPGKKLFKNYNSFKSQIVFV
jgi:hypothetical protein